MKHTLLDNIYFYKIYSDRNSYYPLPHNLNDFDKSKFIINNTDIYYEQCGLYNVDTKTFWAPKIVCEYLFKKFNSVIQPLIDDY